VGLRGIGDGLVTDNLVWFEGIQTIQSLLSLESHYRLI